MKRTDLIRHLEAHGCFLAREGGSHSIYCNQTRELFTSVPRHREIHKYLAKNICRDLAIPAPDKK